MARRFATIPPIIISENQAGFVKARLITENVLLAQELIHSIRHHNGSGNLVIKLDMSKAYDRTFLINAMKKMGFSDPVIDLIYRIISIRSLSMAQDMVFSTPQEVLSNKTPSPLPYL